MSEPGHGKVEEPDSTDPDFDPASLGSAPAGYQPDVEEDQ